MTWWAQKLKMLKNKKLKPATRTATPGHLSPSQPQPVAGPTKAPATGRVGPGQPGPSLILIDFEWFSYDLQRIVNICINFQWFPTDNDMIDNDL